MRNPLSKKIIGIEPSGIRKFFDIVSEMPDAISLGVGEPDFDTPKPICDEAARQLQAGYTHYTDGPGDPDLRRALAGKLRDENHAPYAPENILITPGAKYAVYLAVHAVLNPGDEAMWLTPGWVSYPSIIQACGGVPVAVNLKCERNTVSP